jgi:hypothetical protein
LADVSFSFALPCSAEAARFAADDALHGSFTRSRRARCIRSTQCGTRANTRRSEIEMAMTILIDATAARGVLGDALAASWSGGRLTENDLRALDDRQVLQPVVRYPNENAIPFPLIGASEPAMRYQSETFYSAADLVALTASDVVDAIVAGRQLAGAI